jgi:hypothetical protein
MVSWQLLLGALSYNETVGKAPIACQKDVLAFSMCVQTAGRFPQEGGDAIVPQPRERSHYLRKMEPALAFSERDTFPNLLAG